MQHIYRIILALLFTSFGVISYASAEGNCALDPALQHDIEQILAKNNQPNNFRFVKEGFDGSSMPFHDAKGSLKKLGDYDKTVLFALWASWCGPCRHEVPLLSNLEKKAASDQFDVVAVSVDSDNGDKARDFLSKNASSLAFNHDVDSDLYKKLRSKGLVFGIPSTLLFDKHHCLVSVTYGQFPWDAEVGQQIITRVMATK